MKTLRMTGQFKKDLKRYKNQKEKLEELAKILSLLTENKEIPLRYNPHHLSGDYKDCMECHIQGDFFHCRGAFIFLHHLPEEDVRESQRNNRCGRHQIE